MSTCYTKHLFQQNYTYNFTKTFALKSKIGHANKTNSEEVVLYFQAPTIPIPSRKS